MVTDDQRNQSVNLRQVRKPDGSILPESSFQSVGKCLRSRGITGQRQCESVPVFHLPIP